MRVLAAALAGATILASFAAVPAAAFASFPPGQSVHDGITEDAVAPFRFPKPLVDALQQEVRRADIDEMKLDPGSKNAHLLDADMDYEPHHHCDRTPGATDPDAFNATVLYIRLELESARLAMRNHLAGHAVHALGNALHALQDCHSHSNLVDLPPEVQRTFRAVLLGGQPALVPGLTLTGFLPGAADAEFPPGDPYPHRDFAKDRASANEESDRGAAYSNGTKYEAARASATSASYLVMARFLDNLTVQERLELDAVRASVGPHRVPAPAMPLASGALLSAAALAGRMRPAGPARERPGSFVRKRLPTAKR